ncbi:peptidyl-Lys metalloendopeptidase [Auricularia subglabra TFB-10046 SS5]|nr:peptidyl-Lys metalloendopeptidase [Auricularia subglabra TFB-10046 SS5]
MLSTSLIIAALLVGGMGATARQALSVSLAGTEHFVGVANAVVSATVTNTGDETVKLLNAPNSVLSRGPTDAFAIASADGKVPRFHGLFAKYTPHPGKAFTVLEPGQSVTVEHLLADAYDFTQSGAGAYRIDVAADFYLATNEGVKTLTASVSPHTALLTGDLVKRASLPPPSLSAFSDCTAAHQTALKAASASADPLVRDATAYLSAHTSETPTARYETWFGAAPTAANYSHVASVFDKLSVTSFTAHTYECVSAARCAGVSDSEAFTRPDTPGHFFVCPPFYTAPTSGTESQPGILVHLATHWDAIGHTGHWGDGVGDSKALAISNPALAIDNADSYEFFAENSPQLA